MMNRNLLTLRYRLIGHITLHASNILHLSSRVPFIKRSISSVTRVRSLRRRGRRQLDDVVCTPRRRPLRLSRYMWPPYKSYSTIYTRYFRGIYMLHQRSSARVEGTVQEDTTRLAAEACASGKPVEVTSVASEDPMHRQAAEGELLQGKLLRPPPSNDVALARQGARSFAVDRSTAVPVPVDTKRESSGREQGSAGAEDQKPEGRVVPLLTVDEESLVKSFYAKKIQETCGRDSADEDLRRSDKVQATAVAYFQRFYLSNSVLEHDPTILILTSIFLASKTEEQITNVNLLAKATNRDDLQILGKELSLLQGLSFHLAVFHPYRALPALLEGARLRAKSEGVSPAAERLVALHDGARAALDDILVTELPFLHPPSQLALAALLREGRQIDDPPFDVASMLSREFQGREGWNSVLDDANKLSRDLEMYLPYRVEKDKLRAVNKKLKKFALWSDKRVAGVGDGGVGVKRGSYDAGERRKSKKVKTEI